MSICDLCHDFAVLDFLRLLADGLTMIFLFLVVRQLTRKF